jgi:hypothetical protein
MKRKKDRSGINPGLDFVSATGGTKCDKPRIDI